MKGAKLSSMLALISPDTSGPSRIPSATAKRAAWLEPQRDLASTALVTDIQAAGLTPQELSAALQTAMSKYVREPLVSVIVSNFQGSSTETIRVIGEATRPQAIPYRHGMTLLDVMIQVGGLTEFANGNAAVLVRGTEGGKQYSVRLKDLLKRGDISANVDVRPGDVLIVPQGWF